MKFDPDQWLESEEAFARGLHARLTGDVPTWHSDHPLWEAFGLGVDYDAQLQRQIAYRQARLPVPSQLGMWHRLRIAPYHCGREARLDNEERKIGARLYKPEEGYLLRYWEQGWEEGLELGEVCPAGEQGTFLGIKAWPRR